MPIADIDQIADLAKSCRFSQFTESIKTLLKQAQLDQIHSSINEFVKSSKDLGQNDLAQGLSHYLRRDFTAAVDCFLQAAEKLSEDQLPLTDSLYSKAFVQAQLSLDRRRRPATESAYRLFRQNLTALSQLNPGLAEQIRASSWPEEFVVVNYWNGLHLYNLTDQKLWLLNEQARQGVINHRKSRKPIALGGILSGQEAGFCLDHQYHGQLGTKRAHYLFEPDLSKLRAQLHLRDFSSFLLSKELMIFAGDSIEQQIDEVFGTLLYDIPNLIIDAQDMMREHCQRIKAILQNTDSKAQMLDYYASEEFKGRQKAIARGEIQPRIFIITSRWTTFLKHCAADFYNAFERRGCKCHMYIEENDVQITLYVSYLKILIEFKPDAVMLFSHCRPSAKYFPQELPIIGYMQDKCCDIWDLPDEDLRGHVSEQDLLVCLQTDFEEYFRQRRIPVGQTFVMPIPADEEMFYPLEDDDGLREKYGCDISYVKHGHADTDKLLEQWLKRSKVTNKSDPLQIMFMNFLLDIYEEIISDLSRPWDEREMHRRADEQIAQYVNPGSYHNLHRNVTRFAEMVLPACHRRYYMEGLSESRMSFRLYGGQWSEDRFFGKYAAGPVERGAELNAVYNFSKINLHLQPYITMHQRLAECGLAGGFMMVADLPEEQDRSPARRYFEPGKEIVFFSSKEELVEKCRYYLEHEDERRLIAANMHRRALQEQTTEAGARMILDKWRKLL
ncbi:MAG: glycosyltransferase [Sedimentisphaerales bacterium]|nr:glycosyltransferase [Sedimentisphaerales bacterium]